MLYHSTHRNYPHAESHISGKRGVCLVHVVSHVSYLGKIQEDATLVCCAAT